MVCLGNICRSPLGEGVLAHRLEQEGLSDRVRVDSAGTGAWHQGEPPDPRSTDVAMRHGITLGGRARLVRAEDFQEFDHIFAMDRANLRDLGYLESESDEAPRSPSSERSTPIRMGTSMYPILTTEAPTDSI
jgi:protein-tyrosine phosphatase